MACNSLCVYLLFNLGDKRCKTQVLCLMEFKTYKKILCTEQ